jgi:hypothetical protein
MCTEGLNLNSAVMPQAGQVTHRAIFMVSICAAASWRHWRQFTMSSPSALPMNAKDSESKRGIINSSVPSFFCVLYQQTEGIAHQSAGMRVLVAPFAAGVPLRNVGGTRHRRGDGGGPTNAAAKRSSSPVGQVRLRRLPMLKELGAVALRNAYRSCSRAEPLNA